MRSFGERIQRFASDNFAANLWCSSSFKRRTFWFLLLRPERPNRRFPPTDVILPPPRSQEFSANGCDSPWMVLDHGDRLRDRLTYPSLVGAPRKDPVKRCD